MSSPSRPLVDEMIEERLRLASLQARIPPTQITVLPNGQQVLFLGPNYSKAMSGHLSLQLMNLYNNENNQWGQAFDFTSIANLSTELSLEQKLLRERTRTSAHGITSYIFHAPTNAIVFQYGPHLVMSQIPPLEPITQYNSIPVVKIGNPLNDSLGTRMDPNLTTDGAWIVFTRDNDLWMTTSHPNNNQNASEIRLTFAQNIHKDITAGVADFINEEEFDRYTGYWLYPRCDDIRIENREYRQYAILYLEADSRQVPVISIPSMHGVEQHKWPRAGENNCRFKVKMVTFAVSTSDDADIIINDYELTQSIYACFDWIEYIVRAGWTTRTHECWIQYLDRKQMRSNVVLYTMEKDFVKSSNDNYTNNTNTISATGDTKPPPRVGTELFHIHGAPYINIHDAYKFIQAGVLWVSEHSGFKHLYFVSYPKEIAVVSEESNNPQLDTEDSSIKDKMTFTIAAGCTMQTLTTGDWSVEGESIWFEDKSDTIYFRARRETHLEKHLYSLVLNAQPYKVNKLTKPGFFHDTKVDSIHFKFFTSIYSSTSKPRRFAIYSIDGECIKEFDVPHRGAPRTLKYVEPFIENIVTMNQEDTSEQKENKQFVDLHSFSAVIYPAYDEQYTETKKYKEGGYPTIIYVYGGPHVQLVTNSWDRITGNARCQLWRSLGYTVAMIDGRGSYHRGLAFEGRIKYAMGQIEIQDQVQLVKYLVQRGLTNPKQVGIIGYSYGGYLSLMALCQRPDVFRVGIAGAPVTLWQLYDTGYTERYMGTPQEHKEAYDNASVVKHVKQFPDEEGRVVIIHGLSDENVHFYHTQELINAMVKANKPYVLKIFPGERHGVRKWDNIQYMEKFCVAQFQKMMQ